MFSMLHGRKIPNCVIRRSEAKGTDTDVLILAKLLSSVAVTLFLDFHNLARCLYWETVQLQTVPPLTFMVLRLLISDFAHTLKTYLYLINYETVSFHNLNGQLLDFFWYWFCPSDCPGMKIKLFANDINEYSFRWILILKKLNHKLTMTVFF